MFEDKKKLHTHKLVTLLEETTFAQEMYEEGYHSITNIDLCMTVIKAMQEKYRDKPGCSTAR